MNKKGQEEGMFFLISIIFLSILLITSAIYFNVQTKSLIKQSFTQAQSVTNDLDLINYLNTEVEYNGDKILIADLILTRNKVEENTKEIFENYCYLFNKCYGEFTIIYSDGEVVLINFGSGYLGEFDNIAKGEFILKDFDNGDIKIGFRRGVK
ncbi:hypothetical protein K8R47_01685 [archaeon]|nr:hypothetical protein [archaeon]